METLTGQTSCIQFYVGWMSGRLTLWDVIFCVLDVDLDTLRIKDELKMGMVHISSYLGQTSVNHVALLLLSRLVLTDLP